MKRTQVLKTGKKKGNHFRPEDSVHVSFISLYSSRLPETLTEGVVVVVLLVGGGGCGVGVGYGRFINQ